MSNTKTLPPPKHSREHWARVREEAARMIGTDVAHLISAF